MRRDTFNLHATTRRALHLTMAIGLGLTASANAHHSHPYFYDECRPVTVEGRVERVEWKDPHTLIFVRLDDGMVYTVDWMALKELTNNDIAGPAREALAAGVRVAVTGAPIRTLSEIRAKFPDYPGTAVNPNIVDPTSIRRVDDGWSWAGRMNPNPPDCKSK